MDKYLVSLIGTIIFSITTVILFLLSWAGNLYLLAGSVIMGVIIYFVNMAGFLSFLVFYIWQKAKKRSVSAGTYETLSAYARAQRGAVINARLPKVVLCSATELQRVISERGEQMVTSATAINDIDIGQEVLLSSDQHRAYIVRVKIIGLEGTTLRVSVLSVNVRNI